MVDLAQDAVRSCRAAMVGAVLAAAIVAVAPPTPLAAQKLTDPSMPLPETSRRMRKLEPPPVPGRMYEVWRVGAPPEMLLGWYLRRLNNLSPIKGGTLDTADVRLGDARPAMAYTITLHNFEDRCTDPPDSTLSSDDPNSGCRHWNRGKEKKRILDNNRVGYEWGEWIDRVNFVWMEREATGAITRREIELSDVGLADDWKRYTLVTQITLIRETLPPATP